MPDSTGINRRIGQVQHDMVDVRDKIGVILTTPLYRRRGHMVGPRVMRRSFGSECMTLVARPQTESVLLAIRAAAAVAIHLFEPRFLVTGVDVARLGADGVVVITVTGLYLPRGHLDDFTPANDNLETITVTLGAAA